jgi:hypothetical protein
MTNTERQFLVGKLGKLLQDVLVEIRALSWDEGHTKQINDLADLTHNLPEFLVGSNDYVFSYLRDGFLDYARKYYPQIDPEASRFVRLLDMDESTFNSLYRPTAWTEPAEIAG